MNVTLLEHWTRSNIDNPIKKENNTTGGFGETDPQFVWLLHFAYIVIFLASLFGNSVTVYIIRKNNYMRTTTNYLILNQACADLLVTVAYLVNNLIPYSFGLGIQWFGGIIGQITCKVFVVLLFLPPYFSVWILVAIAVDRYFAVTQPLRSSPLSRHFKKIIALIWAWSGVSLTDVLVNELLVKDKEHYYCNYMNEWMTFQLVSETVNTVLPLFIMAVLYTIVCHRLWSREVPGEGANQNQGQAEAMKTARKVTWMMIVVLLLFLLCWFPYTVYLALHTWGDITISSNVVLFLLWVVIAYSGINPYIYLSFNRQFRHAFKRLFRNCFSKIKIPNVVHIRTQSYDLEHGMQSYELEHRTQSYDLELRTQSFDLEHGTQSYDLEHGTQSYDLEHGTQSCDLEHGTQSYDLEHGTQSYDLEHGTQSCDLEHGTQIYDLEHGTQSCDLEHGTQSYDLEHITQSCDLEHGTKSCDLEHGTQSYDLEHRTQSCDLDHRTQSMIWSMEPKATI